MNELTDKALLIEARHGGKPLRDILLESYYRHRSWATVADEVGATRNTVNNWRNDIRLTGEEVERYIFDRARREATAD